MFVNDDNLNVLSCLSKDDLNKQTHCNLKLLCLNNIDTLNTLDIFIMA